MVYNVLCLENSLVFKVFFLVNFHMQIKNRTATLIWSVSSPVSISWQYQSNLYISSSKLLTISPSYGTFLLLNKIVFIPTFLAAPKYPLLSSIYKHSSALTASFWHGNHNIAVFIHWGRICISRPVCVGHILLWLTPTTSQRTEQEQK